jgi:hypothetical protein
MMRSSPLRIWFHPRPEPAYFCAGCASSELSDVARQLKIIGYAPGTRIEIVDAESEEPILIELEDPETGEMFTINTIGRALTGKRNAPNSRYSTFSRPPAKWLSS